MKCFRCKHEGPVLIPNLQIMTVRACQLSSCRALQNGFWDLMGRLFSQIVGVQVQWKTLLKRNTYIYWKVHLMPHYDLHIQLHKCAYIKYIYINTQKIKIQHGPAVTLLSVWILRFYFCSPIYTCKDHKQGNFSKHQYIVSDLFLAPQRNKAALEGCCIWLWRCSRRKGRQHR